MLARRRLAGRVRRLAKLEREERHRAAVVEFGPMRAPRAVRGAPRRIEDRRQPLPAESVRSIEAFLAEDPPARDHGSNALARNERIAALLAELDGSPR